MTSYETLAVSVNEHIATVKLNRTDKANAINAQMLVDLKTVFVDLDAAQDVRVIILGANGKSFCAGIDFAFFSEIFHKCNSAEGHVNEALRQFLLDFQASFNAIEACRKPVIASVQGACIGGGLDMIAACDMRFCTEEASFSIKEIDMGIVADAGSLQRLPYLINRGILHELAYTGRNIGGKEAVAIGMLNRYFSNQNEMEKYISTLSKEIAAKSPSAIRGIKHILLYSRDHSVTDSLNYIATWNSAMLLSRDLTEAQRALKEQRPPKFND